MRTSLLLACAATLIASATAGPNDFVAVTKTCSKDAACPYFGGRCLTGSQQDGKECVGNIGFLKLCQKSNDISCKCCWEPQTKDCKDSRACSAIGGVCVGPLECDTTKGDTPLYGICEKISPFHKPKCVCCLPRDPQPRCAQTKPCDKRGGVCASRETCDKKDGKHLWVQKLCQDGSNSDDCGCCIPEPELVCTNTQKCKKKGAECLSKERCAAKFDDFIWNQELCESSNNPEDCGCCIEKREPPPPVCETTNRCRKEDGECVSRDQCRRKGRPFEWVQELCKGGDNDKDCGCCRPVRCKPKPKCNRAGGKCLSQVACSTFMGYKWDQDLCDSPLGLECGCCMPPVCEQTDECKKVDGKCKPQEKCPLPNDWIARECSENDPTGASNCGCCQKPRCTQTQECSDIAGFCVRDADYCKHVQKGIVAEGVRCEQGSNCVCCAAEI